MKVLVENGASIIGDAGTTPEFIHAMHKLLK